MLTYIYVKSCGYIVVSFQVVSSSQFSHILWDTASMVSLHRRTPSHHSFQVFVFGDTYVALYCLDFTSAIYI